MKLIILSASLYVYLEEVLYLLYFTVWRGWTVPMISREVTL
jgi:hypothetical protein